MKYCSIYVNGVGDGKRAITRKLGEKMPKKKRETSEFCFCEIPYNEPILALMGSEWIRVYGENVYKRHFHNLLEIGYCHYGVGELIIEEDQHHFESGTISCIPANIRHVTRSDTNVEAFWEYLYICPEDVLRHCGRSGQEIKDSVDRLNEKAIILKSEEDPIMGQLIKAIFQKMQNKNSYYQECVSGLVYALLFEIILLHDRQTEVFLGKASSFRLENAIVYIEKNYSSNFKISDLASECHMSETHFRKIFQENMNMTPIEYINFVRVKKACDLIDKTDSSMEDVAEQVGFITPSTFNRNFRRIIGTSPYQWKRRPVTIKKEQKT